MDEDSFKLSGDDTMRHLRTIAQSPGELQWRMELLSKLERMQMQQEVSNRGILQMLGRVRKDVSHLTPTKLAELINAQIDQKRKDQDSTRWRVGAKWLLTHVGTALFTLLMAYLTLRVRR